MRAGRTNKLVSRGARGEDETRWQRRRALSCQKIILPGGQLLKKIGTAAKDGCAATAVVL